MSVWERSEQPKRIALGKASGKSALRHDREVQEEIKGKAREKGKNSSKAGRLRNKTHEVELGKREKMRGGERHCPCVTKTDQDRGEGSGGRVLDRNLITKKENVLGKKEKPVESKKKESLGAERASLDELRRERPVEKWGIGYQDIYNEIHVYKKSQNQGKRNVSNGGRKNKSEECWRAWRKIGNYGTA